jgi:hypothetical protein
MNLQEQLAALQRERAIILAALDHLDRLYQAILHTAERINAAQQTPDDPPLSDPP